MRARNRRLYARGDIGRVAEHIGLLTAALAHHHRAGMDSDADRESYRAMFNRKTIVEQRDCLNDREAAANRQLRIVLVRLRIAEVNY